MATYTQLTLTEMKLSHRFIIDHPYIYGWLVEKEKFQNSEEDLNNMPYFYSDYETHANVLFHNVWKEFIRSHKNIEVARRLTSFGSKTSNLYEKGTFSLNTVKDGIIISVDYSTSYSVSIGIWLKWFRPYILNESDFGEIYFEDDDLENTTLNVKIIDEIIKRLDY